MREENPMEEGQAGTRRSFGPTQKKALLLTGLLLLMAGCFFLGRWTVNPSGSNVPTRPGANAPSMLVTQQQLGMINFSGVPAEKINEVLSTYNQKKCGCGCNMSIAQCLVEDPNCPQWHEHAQQLQEALGNGAAPNLSHQGNPLMNFPAAFPTLPGNPALKKKNP